MAAALKEIYRATGVATGQTALDAFAAGPWGAKYPAIAMSWRRHWQEVIPFFAFPDEVRRIIYTTNAIEALNSKLRRSDTSNNQLDGGVGDESGAVMARGGSGLGFEWTFGRGSLPHKGPLQAAGWCSASQI